jgi:hypothetical protein
VVDKGFNAISPVTTNFRGKDFEKLERLTQGVGGALEEPKAAEVSRCILEIG